MLKTMKEMGQAGLRTNIKEQMDGQTEDICNCIITVGLRSECLKIKMAATVAILDFISAQHYTTSRE